MIKPNFFIIGAPKCATTSLAAWLAEHPNIYMSPTKEPHFFNTDYNRFINSIESYEHLFEGATDNHRAVGEASVWYLHSSTAVKNILAYNHDAKFIVMLRNPIDMAPSLHEELVFTGREDVKDFAAAWGLQEARREGACLPRMVWEPKYVQYGDSCCLGEQVDRLFKTVPRGRVKVVLLDDLRNDPGGTYHSVLQFLGVDGDHRSHFNTYNQAKSRRWPALLKMAWVTTTIKRALGIEGGLGLWTRVDALNRIERQRPLINSEMRMILRNYFRSDIERLELLIERDLSHWLTSPERNTQYSATSVILQ
jgi:Sulfotransferase domain